MKVSELMKAMSDAGAPMEAILIAVQAIEEREGAVEASRSAARERKRRQRARDKDGTVTGQSRDMTVTVTDEPSLSPSPLSSPQTPQQTPRPHTHPDIIPARKGRAGRSKLQAPAKPDGVEERTWADFLAHRKAKGSPLSETAMAGIRREAEKAGWTLESALSETMTRGWQAFKAEWVDERKPPTQRGSEPANYLDHYLAKQAAGGTR